MAYRDSVFSDHRGFKSTRLALLPAVQGLGCRGLSQTPD